MKVTKNSTKDMHKWFRYLFEQQMNSEHIIYCFECGKALHENFYKENICCYSHLIEKSKYPKYAGHIDNLKIVCPDCHTLFTMRPKKATFQYMAAQLFKQKHNI